MRKSRPARAVTLALGLATAASSQQRLPFTELQAFVDDAKSRMGAAESEAFRPPSDAERREFAACFRELLETRVREAEGCLARHGYALGWLRDELHAASYLVAYEPDGARGQGTFIVRPDWVRNLLVAAPHPLHDLRSPEVARELFQELGGRALVIAGTHRCANAEPAACSGSTSVCGGSYRVSDVAHAVTSFVHAAHEAALELSPEPVALSVHGQVSDSRDIVLSDGTTLEQPPGALVNRLRDALVARGLSAGSCNSPADPGLDLCGTRNTQGRLYNGSPLPCSLAASSASGRFLHLELKPSIRSDPSGLRAAFAELWPLERVLLFATRDGDDVILRFFESVEPLAVARDSAPRFDAAPRVTTSFGPVDVDARTPSGPLFYCVD